MSQSNVTATFSAAPGTASPSPRGRYRRTVTVLASSLLVSCLLAAACSGDDRTAQPTPAGSTPAPSPTVTPRTPSDPATTPTHAPLSGPLKLTKGMTRPGARLRFGQKAIVPIRQYHPIRGYTEGVLGVVVQRIQRVPATRIQGHFDAHSAALLKKSTAYYTKIIITNESGNPMPLEMPRFDGLHGDGQLNGVVLVGGELPGCRTTDSPTPFDRKGARWLTCELWVSSPSRPIRQVRYMEPPYGEANRAFDDARFNRYYNLGTITWS